MRRARMPRRNNRNFSRGVLVGMGANRMMRGRRSRRSGGGLVSLIILLILFAIFYLFMS